MEDSKQTSRKRYGMTIENGWGSLIRMKKVPSKKTEAKKMAAERIGILRNAGILPIRRTR